MRLLISGSWVRAPRWANLFLLASEQVRSAFKIFFSSFFNLTKKLKNESGKKTSFTKYFLFSSSLKSQRKLTWWSATVQKDNLKDSGSIPGLDLKSFCFSICTFWTAESPGLKVYFLGDDSGLIHWNKKLLHFVSGDDDPEGRILRRIGPSDAQAESGHRQGRGRRQSRL